MSAVRRWCDGTGWVSRHDVLRACQVGLGLILRGDERRLCGGAAGLAGSIRVWADEKAMLRRPFRGCRARGMRDEALALTAKGQGRGVSRAADVSGAHSDNSSEVDQAVYGGVVLGDWLCVRQKLSAYGRNGRRRIRGEARSRVIGISNWTRSEEVGARGRSGTLGGAAGGAIPHRSVFARWWWVDSFGRSADGREITSTSVDV